jgi:hypothetical protein
MTFFQQILSHFLPKKLASFLYQKIERTPPPTPPPQTEEGLSFVFSRYPAEQEQIPLENRVN